MFEKSDILWKLLILKIYIIIQADILENCDILWIKVIVIEICLSCKKKKELLKCNTFGENVIF